jgi:hypothetical protein
MDTMQWLIGAAVLAVLAVIVFASISARKQQRLRHDALKHRFGPEYDREVEAKGSVARAERELVAREKRVRQQRLTPLADQDRARFSEDWRAIQARFVDDPSSAVTAADDLIKSVMFARGYQVDNADRRIEDLTVEHADVVQHYRAARELSDANREGRANTEELRQALVHYRELFADLLEAPRTAIEESRAHEAHA